MPFKSKAQQRFMFAAEARGELPKGKALEWAHETKNIKKLQEHKMNKTAEQIADTLIAKLAMPRWLREAAINPGLLASEQAARVGVNESARKMLTPMQRMSDHHNALKYPPDLFALPRPLTTHADSMVRSGPEGLLSAAKDGIHTERTKLRMGREYNLNSRGRADVPFHDPIRSRAEEEWYRLGRNGPPPGLDEAFGNSHELLGLKSKSPTLMDKIKGLFTSK